MDDRKTTLYVVPHTHWDREWYGSFQLFRVRLVRLLDKLLAILERDPAYRTFNLDGQTILLEDYLEIHPERRETLRRHVSEGRLMVGPWYILPDEFLSSGESMVRNLLLGKRMAEAFGHRMEVGYIPDTFGHIAQLPQILLGFGLDTCMHFRGLDSGGRKSELWWEAPDGSRVLLHHLSTVIGYSDLGAMADDPLRAAHDLRATAYYKAERATGDVLLAMQGVDHSEARADLPAIIALANDRFPDIRFVHASLEEFWAALKASVADKELETVHGELRDVPRAPGSVNILLYNVLSSRVDNKLQNARTLLSLERWAEPWAVLAWLLGVADYPRGHLWTGWKWLLKNHPHDSLGGCSVDEVHRQMATRFEWAREIADCLAEERFRLIAERLDLSAAAEDELALVVFNATPWERDEVVTVEFDLPEHWLRKQALARHKAPGELTPESPYLDVKNAHTRADWLYGMPELPEVFFRGLDIRPADGGPIPVQIHDVQQTATAIALASGPRGVLDVRRVRASFRARLPAYGYASYFVATRADPSPWRREIAATNMENEHLRVAVQPNGTFDLTVKGDQPRTHLGLGLLEDGGDNGDGYTFSPPPFDRVYTTGGAHPRIAAVGTGVGLKQIRIEYDLVLPVGLTDDRRRRRDDTVVSPVTVDLVLREGSRVLEIGLEVANRARDHRLRMRFPTGFRGLREASSAMQFDVRTRPVGPEPIEPGAWWVEDPPATFPMHGWMAVASAGLGLAVIAEGLHEFAVDATDDGADVAITLLRAVGCLGAGRDPTTIVQGGGPGIPTPEAQLQKSLCFRLALYPHRGTWQEAEVPRQAQAFLTPPRALTSVPHGGDLPARWEGFAVSGDQVVPSAVKQSEDGEAAIVRLCNPGDADATATLTAPVPIREAQLTDLQEEVRQPIPLAGGNALTVAVPAKKIVTLRLVF